MRGGQPGHHVAVRRRPGAVVVHSISEPERPVVEQRPSRRHVEVRHGGSFERPRNCFASRQVTGVGDAARLQPQVVAHGSPEHATLAVEAADEPHLVVDVDHEPAGLHRPAGRAGAAGQGWNDYAMGEGEQKPPGRRLVDHDASPGCG